MQVCRCQCRDETLPNHSTNAELAVEAKHMHYQLRHVDGLAGNCVKTGGNRVDLHLQVEKDQGMQVCTVEATHMHYQLRHVDGSAGHFVKTGRNRLGMHLQVENIKECKFAMPVPG